MLLAEAAGEFGRVTGLDLSPQLLAHAVRYVTEAGLAERIAFKEGDVNELPFDDNSFDWAWSMDCIVYLPQDPLPALQELARVVKPGGRVAILAWSSECLLPGYPRLEARLKATAVGLAPFRQALDPQLHFMRSLGWLHVAGLNEIVGRTFAGDISAPLKDGLREGAEAILQMRWPGVEAELSAEDRREYQRLCRPESADYILRRPDYYGFFTYTMFTGLVGNG
jgi:demethylmenaquinone methyltransferase/2-methoxy-6-polyprenyl-1,4-benzoquinol methylase